MADLDPAAQRRICTLIAGLESVLDPLGRRPAPRELTSEMRQNSLTRDALLADMSGLAGDEYLDAVAELAAKPDLLDPVEAVPGARGLIEALEAWLNGEGDPIRRWLGMDQAEAPDADQKSKALTLVEVEALRDQGMTREEAAEKFGADQRTLSRWAKEPAGDLARDVHELNVRLDGISPKRPRVGRKSRTK